MYFMGGPPILSGYFLCYVFYYMGKSRSGQSEKLSHFAFCCQLILNVGDGMLFGKSKLYGKMWDMIR